VSPELVKRVHKLYEELGREDVRAVEDLEKAGRDGRKDETKADAKPEAEPKSEAQTEIKPKPKPTLKEKS
jgi:hypothetical protein